MSETYSFIDGAYLRTRYAECMREFFGEEGELDFGQMKEGLGRPWRAFYYDCLNDVPETGESQQDFRQRVANQEAFFSRARSTPGFHVRLGTLKGEKKKKRRQKEVDILLAVDMLTHSFWRNMGKAILIAGDLDFRPVVEAVVRLGVWVTLMADRESVAEELTEAVDHWQPITPRMLLEWSSTDFQVGHPLPSVGGHGHVHPEWQLVREGIHDGAKVCLYRTPNNRFFLRSDAKKVCLSFDGDEDKIVLLFRREFGEIAWADTSVP